MYICNVLHIWHWNCLHLEHLDKGNNNSFSERNSPLVFVSIFHINKTLIQPLKLYSLKGSNLIHCCWIVIFTLCWGWHPGLYTRQVNDLPLSVSYILIYCCCGRRFCTPLNDEIPYSSGQKYVWNVCRSLVSGVWITKSKQKF